MSLLMQEFTSNLGLVLNIQWLLSKDFLVVCVCVYGNIN